MIDKKILSQIIWDKWSAGKKSELKPSELGWNQDAMPWKAEFKSNLADSQPLVYRAEGKHISFKPAGLWWTTPQGKTVIKQGVNSSVGSLVKGKIRYANTLSTGIDVEMSVSRTRWNKLISINSLSALGTIPADAEFLEIGFEIETDFDIEGWDKKSEFEFTKSIKLSELSRLRSIRVRDNHIIPEPKEGDEPERSFLRCDGFLREQDGNLYLVKKIPVGYLKQAVYPVITDTIITFGSKYDFNPSVADPFSCAALDATHFVASFYDGDSKSVIGVVSSGDEIAYGSQYEFAPGVYSRGVSCAKLDATHFVVCYYNNADDGGYATIGVVSSGNVITFGSIYKYRSNSGSDISCAGLDTTHFVVCFRDLGDPFPSRAIIGVVSSGDVIAYGSYATMTSHGSKFSCSALDATHFVICYFDLNDSRTYAKIGVVTGDAIAFGSYATVVAVWTGLLSCAGLDATHFVVGYYRGPDTRARIGVVSGDAITFGSEYSFIVGACAGLYCAALDDTHFVICYQDSYYGRAIIGVVSLGDEIAYGSEYQFAPSDTGDMDPVCAALDTAHFVVVFRDTPVDDDGTAIIGVVSEPIVLPTVTAQAASSVEDTTATTNGNITDNGGENCDKRGVVYDTSTHADPGDVAPGASGYANFAEDTDSFGTGAFTKAISGLPPGTTIYYRMYAHNSAGYDYSNTEITFLTKPAAPTNVDATDGDHSDKVVITWTKSTGATGYQVYRDGGGLGWLGDVATYDDGGAGAPSITPGNAVAGDGGSTAHVALSIAGEGTSNGTTHTYKVRARNATGESDDSGTNTGYRAPGALSYQWQRSAADSDAAYGNIGGATTEAYNDVAAPAPTVTPGAASASDGTSPVHVTLSLAGESANIGDGRFYRCVLDADGCAQQITGVNRGYRGVGGLTYQWQRSAADSDAGYGALGGATTDPFNDTTAPANGEGRWYYCEVSATGAVTQDSTHDRGYRWMGEKTANMAAKMIAGKMI